MKILAAVILAAMLAGCTVVRHPHKDGEHVDEPRRGTHVILLICIFASCRDIYAPPELDEDYVGP